MTLASAGSPRIFLLSKIKRRLHLWAKNMSIPWRTAIAVSVCITIRKHKAVNWRSAVVVRKNELHWLGFDAAESRGQNNAGCNRRTDQPGTGD